MLRGMFVAVCQPSFDKQPPFQHHSIMKLIYIFMFIGHVFSLDFNVDINSTFTNDTARNLTLDFQGQIQSDQPLPVKAEAVSYDMKDGSFVVNVDEPYERVKGGVQLVENFYERFNATEKVDLVFILDRSGSVPRSGWFSMINFVRDLLEHFTVDSENTRVAMITFSTEVSEDISDLTPRTSSDRENKCTLIKRIENYVKPKVTFGHTATYSALRKAYNILLESRPEAKKAVFVLTDGHSNIGPAPVRAAFDIKSLSWPQWNSTKSGPQVEIYALGIENATLDELESMASDLPRHVFLIPDFRDFSDLARRLHAHKQAQTWIPAAHAYCTMPCKEMNAHCMCGTRVGEYDCICPRGHHRENGVCQECPKGTYKTGTTPDRCVQCPVTMTTEQTGASSPDQCVLHPSLRICPDLPEIENGTLFYVRGNHKDEVYNTGVPCTNVSAGNSCHYQCDVGFRLSEEPIMVCNNSAKWEGRVPTCAVVECMPVEAEYGQLAGGDILYVDNSTEYGSRIQVTCHAGHQETGATLWTCDEHGSWTRPHGFRCLEMWCNPFPSPANMSVQPKACDVNKQRLGTKCSVTCSAGFELEGPPGVYCGFSNNTAAWLPSQPRCKDITAPVITCPGDQVFHVDTLGGNFTTYNYINHRPSVKDNSGLPYELAVTGDPADLRFHLGHNFLQYTATDLEGNYASCTQRIEVRAREVETQYCPGDQTFTIDNKSGKKHVSWHAPVFVSSQGDLLVTKCASELNNQELTSGLYNMDCYPEGYPGTEKCTFTITVKEPECPLPDPEPAPAHGSLKCSGIVTGGAKVYPRTCKIMCREGFELKLKSLASEHLKAESHIDCHWDGQWEIHPDLWPECARTRRPKELETDGKFLTSFPGKCEDNRDLIAQAFSDYILHSICGSDVSCELTDLQVHCRTRRSKRDAQLSSNDTTEMLNNTVTLNTTLKDLNETTMYLDDTEVVTIEYALNVRHSDDRNMTKEDQIILAKTVESRLNSLYDTMDAGGTTLQVGDLNATVTEIKVNKWPEFNASCSQGEIYLKESAAVNLCYECPAGTYKASDEECLPCSHGSYQDTAGQSDCKICPIGTNTTVIQAKHVSQCRAPCPIGTYSATGRETCTPCPRDTYQPETGETECVPCANGTSTAKQGSVHESQCGILCEAGTWSRTGLQPCEACLKDSYQPQEGATECLPCPGNGKTKTSGAANISACLDTDFCLTDNNTRLCGELGRCVSQSDSYLCICDDYHTGEHCQVNIDDCQHVTCLHGGICLDGLGQYTCKCPPQYAGQHCEYERNECESAPCVHGICEDKFGGYSCHCLPGYHGDNCDVIIDSCEAKPCFHGAKCSYSPRGFTCHCLPQYTGVFCELLVDRCSSSPCQAGGLCSTNGSQICQCPLQYTGVYCETEIDFCAGNPCYNNGTCWNTHKGPICKCPVPYTGPLCQTDGLQDFDLVFESGVTNDYVMLNNALPSDLHQLSLCTWLRSSDTVNFGTIVSYAKENNWLSADDTNVFTLYDYGRLQVYINGEVRYTGLPLNTGRWQHLCVTWDGITGDLYVYINGTMNARGINVATGTHISSGGVFVIGQEQDSVGNSFSSRESFIGELTQLHMYSQVLTETQILAQYTSNKKTDTCSPSTGGDIIAWAEVLQRTHGNVRIRNESLCLDFNECQNPQACKDNEVCEDVRGSHVCHQVGDPCTAQPCKNQGVCESLPAPGQFICKCQHGYIGKRCEVEVDFCDSNPCKNGATCESKRGQFWCRCPVGVTGHRCDIEVNICPCENGGICNDINNTTSCICPPEYTGEHCKSRINACGDLVCLNGGSCYMYKGRHICHCSQGWMGNQCQVMYTPSCDAAPCINNGTCVYDASQPLKYRCECPEMKHINMSYGPQCEHLTPCDSAPCLHRSTCVNKGVSDYVCVCPANYSGPRCETFLPDLWTTTIPTTPVDYCQGVTCENFGTCVSLRDHFHCDCTLKYRGTYCDQPRKQETRVYVGTVSLTNVDYSSDLKYDEDFKKRFRAEMVRIYRNITGDSILRVSVKDVHQGSVLVDFLLEHDVFVDSKAAALDEHDMKRTLVNELARGRLGIFPASLEKFQFMSLREKPVDGAAVALYVSIGILGLVLVVVITVVMCLIVRRRRGFLSPRKLNNKRDEMLLTRINNPTFDQTYPNSTPVLNHRGCADAIKDNIYAEPGDVLPYYATSDCTDDTSSLGSRYPSKRGRDVNIDWDSQRGNTADEYLEPVKDKNCFDNNYNEDKEYLEPVKCKEYLEPIKDKEYLEPVKEKETAHAIKDEGKPASPEQYYFTPLPDEDGKANNIETASQSTGASNHYKVPNNNNPVKAEEYTEPVSAAVRYINTPDEYLDMSHTNGAVPKKIDYLKTRKLPPIPR